MPGAQARRARRVTLPVLALAGTFVGCGSVDPGVDNDFAAFAEGFLGYPVAEATANGLSPGAAEILSAASDRGILTSGDVQEAINLTLSCFDDAGIPYERVAQVDHLGLAYEDFTFRAPAGTADDDQSWLALADACQDANSLYITALYEAQPASLEARESWFTAQRRDESLACLEAAGVDVPAGADFSAYVELAKDALDTTGESTCLEQLMG